MSDQALKKLLMTMIVVAGFGMIGQGITALIERRSEDKLVRTLQAGVEKRDELIAEQNKFITLLKQGGLKRP